MAFAAGVRVGPHEILAFLGAGGIGEVYKARDTRLHRIIALKTLPAEKVADAERKLRFLVEARGWLSVCSYARHVRQRVSKSHKQALPESLF